mmetsp:Transcript_6705/g.27230  ORF Transcript_6705/g.27230 Transcript_6705/m.27230 type:complete len:201 (-) Transcript_6705:630-1232(-)
MVAASVKEKSSLSFSNSDRQMFLYSEYVKKSMRFPSLCSRSVFAAALRIAWSNKRTYHASEYWYMGSMLHSSPTLKNRCATCTATGRYPSRVSSICCSVTAATACFSAISLDSVLALEMISMAVSDSRMDPSLDPSTSMILSSTSLSWRAFSAPWSTSRTFSSSRSGRSLATAMPSSWSVRPSMVIIMFSSVTFTEVSGR